MTAHAVASTPAVPPATRHAAATGAPGPAAQGHFDHQLQAARQRHAPRDPEPSPAEPKARGLEAKEHPSGQRPTDPDEVPAPPPPMSTAAPGTAPPVKDAPEPAAADTKATTGATEVDDQAASTLASAMLALIGPSVAGALRPAAAAARAAGAPVQAAAGKTVATDASATLLLQPGTGADATAPVDPATALLAGTPAGKDGLMPIAAFTTVGKDGLSSDASPNVALPAAPATPALPATPVLQLPSPVGTQAFAQDLGQQVAWLGGQGIKQARIRLHPEELGSLDVKVSVTHGRVDVVFSAQHPGAVAAVQQSLPQLDHMLAQHGLSLGHAEVGQHGRGDRHGAGDDTRTAALDEPGEIHGVDMTTPLGQIGLVDAFA